MMSEIMNGIAISPGQGVFLLVPIWSKRMPAL